MLSKNKDKKLESCVILYKFLFLYIIAGMD